jgi:hypothetical protein
MWCSGIVIQPICLTRGNALGTSPSQVSPQVQGTPSIQMRIASPRAGGEYVHHPDDDQHEQILRTFVPEKVLLSADLRILPEPYELVRAASAGHPAWTPGN